MKEVARADGEQTLPVVLAIDAEPEAGGGTWRDPAPWHGLERWLEAMPQLRDRLATASGAPARLAWFVRCDPQVGDIYGDPAWAADHYAAGFAALRAAGDEIAIHPHAWRWDSAAREWVHDNGDPAWVESVLETGFERFAAGFGSPALAHRFGSRYMTAAIARWLDAHGVRVDTTLEPGSPGLATLDKASAYSGTVPDQRRVPRQPYRPDPDDPFRPASSRTMPGGLWMLPHSAFDPQPLIPRWRRLARRVRFLGQQRHRPGQLWTPQDPNLFWDVAVRAAQALPRPYLFLALRCNALSDPAVSGNVTAKLDALERHPSVARMRFVTAREALDLLTAGE